MIAETIGSDKIELLLDTVLGSITAIVFRLLFRTIYYMFLLITPDKIFLKLAIDNKNVEK